MRVRVPWTVRLAQSFLVTHAKSLSVETAAPTTFFADED
jgi:hypothetical protein